MQPSGESRDVPPVPGRDLATLAEVLFVASLLVLPVLAFLALAWLFIRRDKDMPTLTGSR